MSAQTATVLPALRSASLISVGQICDDHCTMVFNKDKVLTAKDDKIKIQVEEKDVLFQGNRNKNDGLYDIAITTIQPDNYV